MAQAAVVPGLFTQRFGSGRWGFGPSVPTQRGMLGSSGVGREGCLYIPAQKLVHYLGSLQFPVDIYDEKSDQVIGSVTRRQLLQMIQNGTVSGVGSWKRIRKLRRVAKPASATKAAGRKSKRRLPVAEDSYTWESISVPGGGRYFQPHEKHCAAFSPESRKEWK